jgi:heme exporter protein A
MTAAADGAAALAFDAIDVAKVSRVYGQKRALHAVDLRIAAGESIALVGPNGAGKSTLVGILATMVVPSTGEVRYGGRPADAEIRRAIGVVAHESLLYGDLTGRENLRFFAALYGVGDPRSAADEALRRVALDEQAADRATRTYSRGMLQRLALARALIHRPQLLLLDEPFTGLDRQGIDLLRRLLAEERARGAMLVVVTHDFDAAADLVDRVLVLDRGRVTIDERVGSDPRLLLDAYRRGVRAA